MEAKEILEGEMIIASFMGYTFRQKGEVFVDSETGHVGKTEELRKDMNQILLVFKKIRKMGWRVVIDDDKCRITKDKKTFKSHTVLTVNSCYLCILYFLDWHNAKQNQ